MNTEQILTQKENKIRQRWLLVAIQIPLFIIAAPLVIVLIINISVSSVTHQFPDITALMPVAGLTIVGCALLYFSYQWVYEKQGTILLTLFLIIIPLGYLYELYDAFQVFNQESLAALEQIKLHLLLIAKTSFSVWTFYLSWKMIGINKKIKTALMKTSEGYTKALSELKTASTLVELDEKYSAILDRTENAPARYNAGEAYKECKEAFS